MEIRDELRPISPVYKGHPLLSREAAYSLLVNCPMARLQAMCRDLNTNIEQLESLLEKQRIVKPYRPGPKQVPPPQALLISV